VPFNPNVIESLRGQVVFHKTHVGKFIVVDEHVNGTATVENERGEIFLMDRSELMIDLNYII